jgi:hypothetical protein
LLTGVVKAQQQSSFTSDLLFARHLYDQERYAEAVYVLDHISTQELLQPQKDSLLFWQGWTAYTTKKLKLAASRLVLVSDSAAWAVKSHFFAAYCLSFERDTAAARRVLDTLQVKDSIEKEMRYFQLAGLSLLQRDYKQYEQLRERFTFSSYIMESEETRMDTYSDKLSHYKKKSPLLAGVYSAIIPGAGKIYAGKKKQGIGSFFPVLSLAALTWEAYNRGGVKSARFIGFGSLFSLFYAGNIWGSVVAVKVKQREMNAFYDNKILFDMHIPLRNLYN